MRQSPCLQKVVEFREVSFWTNRVKLSALNERIAELNREGWEVKQIISGGFGFQRMGSVLLLLESKDS